MATAFRYLPFIFLSFIFSTFSIVAVDLNNGQVGSAGASCIGGSIIISDVHPGVGAIHTQSYWSGYNQLMASDLPALDKALSLLQDCQQCGTLVFAHLARSAFVSVTILKSAVKKDVITQDAMMLGLLMILVYLHILITQP